MTMTSEVMDSLQAPPHNPAMPIPDLRDSFVQPAHAGLLLREWRAARHMSQLELALRAGISARHLSYVENGRSQPGRKIVARLADVLEMPLRERNALLMAAGYAPRYQETALTTVEMKPVRRAIDFIINQQEPYPALVTNRYWDVLMANHALERVFTLLRDRPPMHTNVMRQVFDPADLRASIVNWEEVAGDLIRHLHNDVAAVPTDLKSRALLDEVLAYPGVPARWRTREVDASPLPLLTTVFGRNALELRFFSAFTTFGTPRDVTLDELRIECMFPADEETAEVCRRLARNPKIEP